MKNSGKVFMTGQYIDNLFHIHNYKKPMLMSSSNISEPNSASDHRELANFIKIYFDFGYYLGISPFRLVRNVDRQDLPTAGKEENKKAFRMYVWKLQQFVCAIMHILCLLRIITEARMNTPDRVDLYKANPEQYFLLIMNLFNIIYKGMFVRQLWRHKEDIVVVANFAAGESNLPSSHPKTLQKTSLIRLVLTLNLTMAILSLLAGKYFLSRGFIGWSPTWWYRRLVTSTRYTFFYGNKTRWHEAPETENIELLDHCLVPINLVGLISRYILGYYTDLFLLSLALTLWSSAYSFAQSFGDMNRSRREDLDFHYHEALDRKESGMKMDKWVEKTSGTKWESIYTSFKAIRVLSYLINKALGSTVCWFLGDAILAYSLNLDTIFVSKDFHKRVGLLFNYFCAFGVLFVSADICKQMEAIKVWLSIDSNRKLVPVDQVNIILHEMLAKDVGIRGGDIFTITYPIVATFIGTILTYFIICIQQQTSHV